MSTLSQGTCQTSSVLLLESMLSKALEISQKDNAKCLNHLKPINFLENLTFLPDTWQLLDSFLPISICRWFVLWVSTFSSLFTYLIPGVMEWGIILPIAMRLMMFMNLGCWLDTILTCSDITWWLEHLQMHSIILDQSLDNQDLEQVTNT